MSNTPIADSMEESALMRWAEIAAELEAEYKALWDTVIAFANAPEDDDKEQYAALVAQAIKSRFWNGRIDAMASPEQVRQPTSDGQEPAQ